MVTLFRNGARSCLIACLLLAASTAHSVAAAEDTELGQGESGFVYVTPAPNLPTPIPWDERSRELKPTPRGSAYEKGSSDHKLRQLSGDRKHYQGPRPWQTPACEADSSGVHCKPLSSEDAASAKRWCNKAIQVEIEKSRKDPCYRANETTEISCPDRINEVEAVYGKCNK